MKRVYKYINNNIYIYGKEYRIKKIRWSVIYTYIIYEYILRMISYVISTLVKTFCNTDHQASVPSLVE